MAVFNVDGAGFVFDLVSEEVVFDQAIKPLGEVDFLSEMIVTINKKHRLSFIPKKTIAINLIFSRHGVLAAKRQEPFMRFLDFDNFMAGYQTLPDKRRNIDLGPWNLMLTTGYETFGLAYLAKSELAGFSFKEFVYWSDKTQTFNDIRNFTNDMIIYTKLAGTWRLS